MTRLQYVMKLSFPVRVSSLKQELASSFAAYPIKRKSWLHPSAEINDRTPAFISWPNDPNQVTTPVLKLDYVYRPEKLGWGHYHLLTKESYIALWG